MKRLLTVITCTLLLSGYAQKPENAVSGWWDDNASFVVPILEVGIRGIRPMKEIGVQQTRLDTTELHQNIALSMADVLTFNTSIFVKQYGRATLSTVSFRGTSPSHTQVTWNGMRINSPMLGMTDFSMIPSYFIDDAALLHGTSSVGTSGGGLGGAVLLATRPSETQGFNLQYIQGVGMFKTFDEFLRLNYGNTHWQVSTRAVYSSSANDFKYRNVFKKMNIYDDQYNIVDTYHPIERNKGGDFNDLHLLQEAYYNTGKGDRFGLSAWYIHSRRGVPMLSVDHKNDADYTNEQRERTLRSVVSWDHLRTDWKLSAKAGYIHSWMAYDFLKDKGNGTMEQMTRSRSTVNTVYAQAEGEYHLGSKWLFAASISAYQHMVQSEDKQVVPIKDPQQGGGGQMVPVGYNQGRLELSGYLSVKYRPTERLGLSFTLREELFGHTWAPPIPALFADYLLSKKGSIIAKASVSRNYRFPTLNDLYFLPGGNPDLRAERGFTYDAGLSFAVGHPEHWSVHGEATWFDSRIDDWIIWLPTFKGFWTPKNIKQVHAYGVELKAGLEVQLSREWQLGADGSFSWTPSLNCGDPVDQYDISVNKQLVYIPEFSSSVSGRIAYKSWRFTYKWCYYSERFTTSDNDLWTKIGRVRPYFMSDVSLEKAFAFHWSDLSVKCAVNNLLDEEYESVLSRPMPGINFEVFLEIRPKWGKRR